MYQRKEMELMEIIIDMLLSLGLFKMRLQWYIVMSLSISVAMCCNLHYVMLGWYKQQCGGRTWGAVLLTEGRWQHRAT